MSSVAAASKRTMEPGGLGKKRAAKTGKKLQSMDEDARLKRTAQNRAAQRAFRERKERKMRELEEKVSSLEQIQKQSQVESEFLRSQLSLMVEELRKYRPHTASDNKVLEYLAKYETQRDGDGGDNDKLQKHIRDKMDFKFEYPMDEKKLPSPESSISSSPDSIGANNSKQQLNTSTTPSSSTPSSNSGGWMDPVFYKDDAQNLPSFGAKQTVGQQPSPNDDSLKITTPAFGENVLLMNNFGYDSDLFSNGFNFEDKFDEQVSNFCVKMNQACGTKDHPTPIAPLTSGSSSTLQGLSNTTENSQDNNKISGDNAFPFIDTALAFPSGDGVDYENIFFRNPTSSTAKEDDDFIHEFLDEDEMDKEKHDLINKNLVNEELAEPVDKQSIGEMIVPSTDGQLLKCSEVWDRITAHPRYSEIDIDGLCQELMHSAKCSEKGVVVNAKDVQDALSKHMA